MQKMKITPLETYEAPTLPTLSAARENPALLKNLPARWKKKAAIFACAGIIGMTSLSVGAAQASQTSQDRVRIETAASSLNLDTAEMVLRVHHGGSSGVPFYVAYFTEQEAFGFIREQLEASGLNFDAEPPQISPVQIAMPGGDIRFSVELFDADKGVAIARSLDRHPGEWGAEYLVKQAREMFERDTSDITFLVFHDSGDVILNANESMTLLPPINPNLTWEQNMAIRNEFVAERITEDVRQALTEGLTAQVKAAVESLKEKGILPESILIGD
jgi:hypothetical protein